MFPQSELDNYKLQVELLQEKLQRSEISRQQLEHKLDKTVQKRDAHEKMVRSKARQKYQLFLDEQQRRNERNKQLVQMLERIEQQTEVMNARSERLKMMKLQYEMYFAKLVHTQTRRCIQNSVQPNTHTMSPTSSSQPLWPPVQQSTMEDCNYLTNTETATPILINNPYPLCATTQGGNMTIQTADIPIKTNFVNKNRNDSRNIILAPTTPPQPQLYQYIAQKDVANMMYIPENFAYDKNQETPAKIASVTKINDNISNSSVANLSPIDKKFSETKENSNLSTKTSSTFEEIPNTAMMPQKLHSDTSITTNALNNLTISSNTSNSIQPVFGSQSVNGMPLKSNSQTDNTAGCFTNSNDVFKFNANPQDVRNETKFLKRNEIKNSDVTMPNQHETPTTSIPLQSTSSVAETLLDSSKNKNYLEKQPASFEQSETFLNNTEINSSTTPVSIENIENEIYGELLSPLEIEEAQQQETVPKLLENLVTPSETIESNSSDEVQITQDTASVIQNKNDDAPAMANNNDQNQLSYNYEKLITNDGFDNVQQSEQSAENANNYNNYENIEGAAIIDESQQQYDYSNYDPTQYSYPGYIYDETTGEYKPDPNAPPEQYATDQQYAADGYEQQYQQQDYDYNQTYTEESAGLQAPLDNTVNNDYDTTEPETSSSLTPTDINATQQEMITPPEPLIPSQTNERTEEESTPTTTKVAKPSSILSSADKSDAQKKKKRVNFIDSSETDESAATNDKAAAALSTTKAVSGNLAGSSESDFDFSSSTEVPTKTA